MNTNANIHQDLIYSFTPDWKSTICLVIIIALTIYVVKRSRKK